ncbi:MAG: class I SAM-dependent methyltransferase [Proteobacteria bacterium]|nr:class I SAM-dependent methyltransferase [Pseudomonadota bacterium]
MRLNPDKTTRSTAVAKTSCRICGSTDLMPYVNLGAQPPSNAFIDLSDIATEQAFPLRVNLCRECLLSQLSHVVSAASIFDEYAYLSSSSRALVQYYQEFIDKVVERFKPSPGSVVVDIGSNDGIMLRRYPRDRFLVIGVEPSSAADHAVRDGFDIVCDFFGHDAIQQIVSRYGRASIITATNLLAHVDDLNAFAHNVHNLLDDEGVFIAEFPYLIDMLEKVYFDTIYHEHLSYLSLTPLSHLLSSNGLRVFHVERSAFGASGPALRLFVCRAPAARRTDSTVGDLLAFERRWRIGDPGRYHRFAAEVRTVKDKLHTLLAELAGSGQKIGAFTAPAKGNTLLNFLGLTPDDIVAAAENNPRKIGKVTPGSHIPIVSDEAFLAMRLPYALLLSWNYADFFCQHSDYAKNGGRLIVPLPEPTIL